VLDGLINSAWSSIRLTISTLGFMTTPFKEMGYYLGIDPRIIGLLTFIITISIAYAIYRLIFQSDA
jgi:hypothetical protein